MGSWHNTRCRRSRYRRVGIVQGAAAFVGAYDSIANLVHVYEIARCTLSAYTGNPLVRLRRASDDAESDFSHVSASDPELDKAAITAWLGGANGYIVTVYDQKGDDDITQATDADQPLYVASIQNGHAGGRFDGSNHYLQGAFTNGGALSQPYNYYVGAALDAAAVNDDATYYLYDGDDATNRPVLDKIGYTAPDKWRCRTGGDTVLGGASDSDWHLWSILYDGASSEFWKDTVSEGNGDMGTDNADGLTVGADPSGANSLDGDWVFHIVADPSHSAAQRGAMETAINNYWSFY